MRERLLRALRIFGLVLAASTIPALAFAEAPEPPPTRILILDESNAGLDALLAVPSVARRPTAAQIADEQIAAAVARGSNPELEPANAFRKRSRDLFRTERPVAVGEQEMLLRLRVRAKKRETMSVELRF